MNHMQSLGAYFLLVLIAAVACVAVQASLHAAWALLHLPRRRGELLFAAGPMPTWPTCARANRARPPTRWPGR